MAKSYTIHSHKGGAGKTMLAINMAAYLAKMGKRVVVLDLDLNAPSLQTYAPNREESTINEIFLNNADPEKVIFDATYLIGDVPGKLFLGLADINGDVISQMGQRSKDDLLKDLYILMGLIRNKLPNEPWYADYILVDTPPGLSTLSINGVAATEELILMLKIVNADIEGTRHFLKTIHKALRPTTHLIVNQIPIQFIEDDGKQKTDELLEKRIVGPIGRSNIKFSGVISTNEMLINKELNYAFQAFTNAMDIVRRPIHLMDEENIEFSKNFKEIINSIMGDFR
ncbi:MAG: Sporulation initiation inhibitor protein Soj [Candidatus Heimdallarchaeota archaeon LC_2]|nr:MAG: Sporulation initiation inhibitor protein Soj [Candidatus Heimdallarchaeota archaeon LC_2]